jgi:hypothetical protein
VWASGALLVAGALVFAWIMWGARRPGIHHQQHGRQLRALLRDLIQDRQSTLLAKPAPELIAQLDAMELRDPAQCTLLVVYGQRRVPSDGTETHPLYLYTNKLPDSPLAVWTRYHESSGTYEVIGLEIGGKPPPVREGRTPEPEAEAGDPSTVPP